MTNPSLLRMLVARAFAICLPASLLPGQQWRCVMPLSQHGHRMAYDSVRSRHVMVGGSHPTMPALVETWEYDGARWTQVHTPQAPPARTRAALVFDSLRNRIVMHGGVAANSTTLTDTWEYDGANWTMVPTTASPPASELAAYDRQRGRVVLFRPGDGATTTAQTWEYDGTNWTQVTPLASPPPGVSWAITFDPVRNRTVLFQGLDAQANPSGALWDFDGVTWMQLAGPAPAAGRWGSPVMAFDVGRQRLMVCGGLAPFTGLPLADAWEFSLQSSTWSQTATWLLPEHAQAMTYDTARSATVLIGAGSWPNSGPVAPIWEFNGTTWQAVLVSPPNLESHAMAHDALRGRTILAGGNDGQPFTVTGCWEFDGAGWTSIGGPEGGAGAALAFDQSRGRTVLFTGASSFVPPMGATWEFDGFQWFQAAPPTSPTPRHSHAMAYDLARRRTVLFGGDAGGPTAETWQWDGTNWSFVYATMSPPARSGHAMAHDAARQRTVLYGGTTGTAPLYDTWEFDGTNWAPIAGATVIADGPELAYDTRRGRTVLHGMDPGTNLSRCWEYDGTSWTPLNIGGVSAPANRQAGALAFDIRRGVMVLAGGRTGPPTWTSDTWELVPAAVPTFTRHGTGCAGSAGVPQLDRVGNSLPALGGAFALQLTSLPNTAAAAVLGLGFELTQWRGLVLPIDLGPFGMPGCQVWVAADDQDLLPVTNGATSLSIFIPPSPALAGLAVGAQALSLDPAASNGVGALSNGVIAVLW